MNKKIKPDCPLIGQDGNIFNLMGIAARTLKNNDMREEAAEMQKRVMNEPRKEYFTMIAMLISNIPLLYLLNQSWYHTLMTTTPGQFVLALSGAVVLVTVLLFAKYTKPIEYRR